MTSNENDIEEEPRSLALAHKHLAPPQKTHSHPTQLATEIICRIFSYLSVPDSDEYGNIKFMWPSARYDYFAELPLEVLVRLSLVCRRWREIVVGTPELWSYVMYPKPEYLVRYLARCRRTNLSLVIGAKYEQAENLVASLAERLEELVVREPLQDEADSSVVQYLASSTTLAPHLRSVTVIYYSKPIAENAENTLQLVQLRARLLEDYLRSPKPHLQFLTVHNWPLSALFSTITFQEDAFPRLRSLRLTRTMAFADPETVRQLLLAMPNLETLCIKTSFISSYPFFPSPFRPSSMAPAITIFRLRKLWISSNLIDYRAILPMIKPPALGHTPRQYILDFTMGTSCSAVYYRDPRPPHSYVVQTMEVLSMLGLSTGPCLEPEYRDEAARVSYETASFSFSSRGVNWLVLHLDEKELDPLRRNPGDTSHSTQHSLSLSISPGNNSQTHLADLTPCYAALFLPSVRVLSIKLTSSFQENNTERISVAMQRFCLQHSEILTLKVHLGWDDRAKNTLAWVREVLSPLEGVDEELPTQIFPRLTRLVVCGTHWSRGLDEVDLNELVAFFQKRAELGWSLPLLQAVVLSPRVKSEMEGRFEEVWESEKSQAGRQEPGLYRFLE